MTAEPTTTELKKFRALASEFEEKLNRLPGAMVGDCFPLDHHFADGLYVRRITMPPRTLVVTKIHAKNHPFFILKGHVSVLTEDGVRLIEAPHWGITKSGTKRIIWNHDEVVWITVHRTDSTDLKEIEDQIIAKSFDELDKLSDNNIEQARIEQFFGQMKNES